MTLEYKSGTVSTFRSNPFQALKELLNRYEVSFGSKTVPFLSGAVGYFAYDLKDFVEKLPDNACDDLNLPDCILGFYNTVIACDNISGKTYIANCKLPEVGNLQPALCIHPRLKSFKRRINAGGHKASDKPSSRSIVIESNFSKSSYLKSIEKAKRYIKKGDIYQVNLSQRFLARTDMDPTELYLRLRKVSPAPFSSYLGFGEVAIASSSPERFLMKKGRYIETRPIKGTAPRGGDIIADSCFREGLLRSQKDRAEHIMIVDLERNDLGRMCTYGSVRPADTFVLEKYSNVFHLVSTVTGRLNNGVGAVDCLESAFPGGSITGAPKIRSMEIIEELEPVKRSVYTGAIGYISFDGDMDTSIAIRTFVIKDRCAYFQVGGGIVADSDPEKEYEETLHKAKGLIKALGVGGGR